MNVVSGNVFDAFLQPNSLVVHGCNAQGVMGSGVAKYVKDNFPSAYYEYLRHHEEHGLKLGEVIPALVLPGRWVLNAITQEFYGRDPGRVYVDYQAIEIAFSRVRQFAESNNIATINYPKIGAGLGGGDWTRISSIINTQLDGLDHYLWDPEW